VGKSTFIYCEKCGKKLLERKSNGTWHFKFGRIEGKNETIVDILFYGSLKFKCTRRSCGHVNTLNFFPGISDESNFGVNRSYREDVK
jgi:hypothetical protein